MSSHGTCKACCLGDDTGPRIKGQEDLGEERQSEARGLGGTRVGVSEEPLTSTGDSGGHSWLKARVWASWRQGPALRHFTAAREVSRLWDATSSGDFEGLYF